MQIDDVDQFCAKLCHLPWGNIRGMRGLRSSNHGFAAGLVLGLVVISLHDAAFAGTPTYERVVAWAPKDNLFVVGDWFGWGGEGVMTSPPNQYYVRNLLTGVTLAATTCDERKAKVCKPTGLDCQASFVVPTCEWSDVVKGTPWAKIGFGRKGEPVQDLLTIKQERSGSYLALASGTEKGRLLWLGGSHWEVKEVRRASGDVFVVVAAEYDNGLPVHVEEIFRFPAGDLAADRLSPLRQPRLLELAQRLGFPAYRTAAELAPIPRNALGLALCAAEGERREDLGALWFRRAIKGLPAAEANALTAEVMAAECLGRTRKLLKR